MDKTTKLDSLNNFIDRHKTAITITLTATVTTVACVAMSRLANNGTITFIKEHGLWEEYLTAGEE